jgi:hypothetical protein
MIKHTEIKSYEYGDIKVAVKIDYDNSLVSLIEKGNNLPGMAWGDKKWLFSSRGPDYKNGWLNILTAMRYAIEKSFDELESYNKMKAKEKMNGVEAVLTKATELVKNKSKKK